MRKKVSALGIFVKKYFFIENTFVSIWQIEGPGGAFQNPSRLDVWHFIGVKS